MLGFYTYHLGRQTGFAKCHIDILDTGGLLYIAHYARQLTDTGISQFIEVTQSKLPADTVYDMFI